MEIIFIVEKKEPTLILEEIESLDIFDPNRYNEK